MDLYGRHINVILRKKIRNEQRFASLDELKAQIARDELTARELFGLTSQALSHWCLSNRNTEPRI